MIQYVRANFNLLYFSKEFKQYINESNKSVNFCDKKNPRSFFSKKDEIRSDLAVFLNKINIRVTFETG